MDWVVQLLSIFTTGYQVIAVARNPEKNTRLAELGVTTLRCDTADQNELNLWSLSYLNRASLFLAWAASELTFPLITLDTDI